MVMQAIRCRRRVPGRALKSARALLTQPHTQVQGRVLLEKGAPSCHSHEDAVPSCVSMSMGLVFPEGLE